MVGAVAEVPDPRASVNVSENVVERVQQMRPILDRHDLAPLGPELAGPATVFSLEVGGDLRSANPLPGNRSGGHLRQDMRVRRTEADAQHLGFKFEQLVAKSAAEDGRQSGDRTT